MKEIIRKYYSPIVFFAFFEIIAIVLAAALNNVFYFLNFTYIGGLISVGLILYIKKYKYFRLVVQLGVGTYMLIYLGLFHRENMQIEGFWYYLFSGVFEAAVIHYVVAKILGPLFFGRGWCGYACWTAMILDLLPYKKPKRKKNGKYRFIRYVVFGISLVFVSLLFLLHIDNMETIMFWSFIAGNIIYYAVGIVFALVFRDNRAFCKYVCQITIFLKPASYFAYIRIKVDKNRCIKCRKCESVCPMQIDVSKNAGSGKSSAECILCMKCIEECTHGALKL